MLSEFKRILKEHSDDVYGIVAYKTLSFYTVLSLACILIPVLFLLILGLWKLFSQTESHFIETIDIDVFFCF